jgi:chromosome segregation ATPase
MEAGPLNLDEIEARANAATPGPWMPPTERERGPGCDDRACVVDHEARTDVPALIARVRELEERLSDTEDRRYRLTQELDEALADYQDLWRTMHEECSRLEAECERLKTFAAQNFSQMIRQEAEQMREYGLSYEGVRKVLHEYNDGEISFGKLMDLIRAAARAMAEDMQK